MRVNFYAANGHLDGCFLRQKMQEIFGGNALMSQTGTKQATECGVSSLFGKPLVALEFMQETISEVSLDVIPREGVEIAHHDDRVPFAGELKASRTNKSTLSQSGSRIFRSHWGG